MDGPYRSPEAEDAREKETPASREQAPEAIRVRAWPARQAIHIRIRRVMSPWPLGFATCGIFFVPVGYFGITQPPWDVRIMGMMFVAIPVVAILWMVWIGLAGEEIQVSREAVIRRRRRLFLSRPQAWLLNEIRGVEIEVFGNRSQLMLHTATGDVRLCRGLRQEANFAWLRVRLLQAIKAASRGGRAT